MDLPYYTLKIKNPISFMALRELLDPTLRSSHDIDGRTRSRQYGNRTRKSQDGENQSPDHPWRPPRRANSHTRARGTARFDGAIDKCEECLTAENAMRSEWPHPHHTELRIVYSRACLLSRCAAQRSTMRSMLKLVTASAALRSRGPAYALLSAP